MKEFLGTQFHFHESVFISIFVTFVLNSGKCRYKSDTVPEPEPNLTEFDNVYLHLGELIPSKNLRGLYTTNPYQPRV